MDETLEKQVFPTLFTVDFLVPDGQLDLDLDSLIQSPEDSEAVEVAGRSPVFCIRLLCEFEGVSSLFTFPFLLLFDNFESFTFSLLFELLESGI